MLVRRCRRLHQTRPGGSFKGLELSNQLREFLFCQTPQGLEHGLEQVSHALSLETPSTPRDRGALCGCGSFAARALLCSTAHLILYPYDSVLRVPAQELQRHPPRKTCGLERPPRFPWQRSGVAPDHFGALPASKLRVAPCATSMLPTISPRPWVTLTVTGMVTCVFQSPLTFPLENRPLNLIRILPALDRRRSRKQEM